jgi:hypothetical protein
LARLIVKKSDGLARLAELFTRARFFNQSPWLPRFCRESAVFAVVSSRRNCCAFAKEYFRTPQVIRKKWLTANLTPPK